MSHVGGYLVGSARKLIHFPENPHLKTQLAG